MFPRDKVCAGWITPQVIDDLALDLDDYSRDGTLQPITGFRVGVIGQPALSMSLRTSGQLWHPPLRVRRLSASSLRRGLDLGTPVAVHQRRDAAAG